MIISLHMWWYETPLSSAPALDSLYTLFAKTNRNYMYRFAWIGFLCVLLLMLLMLLINYICLYILIVLILQVLNPFMCPKFGTPQDLL